jgi:streptomycin 3"-adenylyltransferase
VPRTTSTIERYTDRVAERLRGVLGNDLMGVYLHGSLVLGDFAGARSDVDAVAVATRPVSRAEKRELGERLSQRSLRCPADGLELHLLRERALVPVKAPPFELHLRTSAHGKPDRVIDGEGRAGDPDLVMHFAVLREHGEAVIGPRPDRVFPAVPRPLLLAALLHELRWSRQNAVPSYQVLNACRAWRYVDEGLICSKTAGAEWARERLDDASAIDHALGHRRQLTDTHPHPRAAAALVSGVERRLREALGAAAPASLG